MKAFMMELKKLTRVVLLLSVVMALAAGCGRRREAALPPAVTVVQVERGTVSRSIQLFGTLQGEEQVLVYSKITGRVTKITKPEGSTVSADEPIGYVVQDIPGMDYQPGPVRSPINGVVGKIYVETGQTVAPSVPFAAVARFSERLKMKAAVSDADLPFVKSGAKVSVSFSNYPDTVFAGTVTRVSPMLDPLSRSATVEIIIPNRARKLVPGIAGMARIVVEEKKDVVRVPFAARFVTGESRVAVVVDSITQFRAVTFGLQGDEWVEVVSGLQAGEKVVTLGKEGLKEGQKVNPVEAGVR